MINNIIFKEASNEEEVALLNEFINSEYELLKKNDKQVNFIYGDNNYYHLIAKIGESIIGNITLYTNSLKLPIEDELPIVLSPLRKSNLQVIEIGRYLISQQYRGFFEINLNFFRKIFLYSVTYNIDLIVCQSLAHMYEVYSRLGFFTFYSENIKFKDKEFNTYCYPMYLEVRDKIKHIKESTYQKCLFNMEELEASFLESYLSNLDNLVKRENLISQCCKEKN